MVNYNLDFNGMYQYFDLIYFHYLFGFSYAMYKIIKIKSFR